ncbi:multidrug effflux MFS transporter [Nocardioides endophyticus]|uniref:Multidrug effflux MFS transporter n=1 Tax=Nocardioides endophyticus TaxID=1353775 RepID=A0ABP8ZCT5_9ACTN
MTADELAGRVARPATSTPGRNAARTIAIVAVLMSVSPFTVDMYLPALPRIQHDLGATPSQVQLSLTGVLLGLALGQLVIGPLADAFGRRRPVMIGLACHVLASLLCFQAHDVFLLAGLRFLQGLACAAVAVVSMATVRDLFAGADYARVMSRMFLVIGIAPVIAPAIGGVILSFTDWSAIFLGLAGLGLGLLVISIVAFPETLPPERRNPPTFAASATSYRALLSDPTYLALILVGGLMFSTLFSYVSGASFVFQDRFGLSAQQFTVVFASNAVALTVLAQVNPMLIRRFGPARVLTCATVTGLASAVALLLMLTVLDAGTVPVIGALAVSVASYGVSMPNSQGLALNRQGHRAGTAAALMGFTQFVIGSMVAPTVGLGGADGVAMAATMVAATAGATTLMVVVVRRHPDTMAVR